MKIPVLADNPVFRFLTNPRLRGKVGWADALAPLGAAAIVLGMLVYFGGGVVFGVGEAYAMTCGMGYLILCWGSGGVALDPLLQALRAGTGDQVVLTGLSPATWIAGRLQAYMYHVLWVTGVFLPLLGIGWYLGGVTWTTIAEIVLVAFVGGVFLTLLTATLWRGVGTGLAVAAMAFVIVVSVPAAAREHGIIDVYWRSSGLAAIHPILLLAHGQSDSMLAQLFLRDVLQLYDAPGPGGVFAAALAACLVVGVAALVGRPRCWRERSDPTLLRTLNARVAPTNPALAGSNRTLGFSQTTRLFAENDTLRRRVLWECIAVLLSTAVMTWFFAQLFAWFMVARALSGEPFGVGQVISNLAVWCGLLFVAISAFSLVGSPRDRWQIVPGLLAGGLRLGLVGAGLGATVWALGRQSRELAMWPQLVAMLLICVMLPVALTRRRSGSRLAVVVGASSLASGWFVVPVAAVILPMLVPVSGAPAQLVNLSPMAYLGLLMLGPGGTWVDRAGGLCMKDVPSFQVTASPEICWVGIFLALCAVGLCSANWRGFRREPGP